MSSGGWGGNRKNDVQNMNSNDDGTKFVCIFRENEIFIVDDDDKHDYDDDEDEGEDDDEDDDDVNNTQRFSREIYSQNYQISFGTN